MAGYNPEMWAARGKKKKRKNSLFICSVHMRYGVDYGGAVSYCTIFLKILLCMYLFIFGYTGSLMLLGLFSSCGEWGLLSSCSVRASHCGGFSCCEAEALGCMGFRSCST